MAYEDFQIDNCPKTFNCKKALKEHQRTHNQHRPFKCELCDQTFTQYSSLQKHARVHDKKKPYKCNFEGCDQAFSQDNRDQYKCIFEGCDKMYLYPSSLKKHYSVSHVEEYERFLKEEQIETCGFHMRDDDNIPYQLNESKTILKIRTKTALLQDSLNPQFEENGSSQPICNQNQKQSNPNQVIKEFQLNEKSLVDNQAKEAQGKRIQSGIKDSKLPQFELTTLPKKRHSPQTNQKLLRDLEEIQGMIKRQKREESHSEQLEKSAFEKMSPKANKEDELQPSDLIQNYIKQCQADILKQQYVQLQTQPHVPDLLGDIGYLLEIEKKNALIKQYEMLLNKSSLVPSAEILLLKSLLSDQSASNPSLLTLLAHQQALNLLNAKKLESFQNSLQYNNLLEMSLKDQLNMSQENQYLSTIDHELKDQLQQQVFNFKSQVKQDPSIYHLINEHNEKNEKGSNNSVISASQFIKPTIIQSQGQATQKVSENQTLKKALNDKNQEDLILKDKQAYQFKAKKISDLQKPLPKLIQENVRLNSAQFDTSKGSILEGIPSIQQSSPDVRVKNFFNFNFGLNQSNNQILKLIEASNNINNDSSSNQEINQHQVQTPIIRQQNQKDASQLNNINTNLNKFGSDCSSPARPLAIRTQRSFGGAFHQVQNPLQQTKFNTSLSLFSEAQGLDQESKKQKKSQFFSSCNNLTDYNINNKSGKNPTLSNVYLDNLLFQPIMNKETQDQTPVSQIPATQRISNLSAEMQSENKVFALYLQHLQNQTTFFDNHHMGARTQESSRHPSIENCNINQTEQQQYQQKNFSNNNQQQHQQ